MRVLRFWRLGFGAALALCVGAALAADPAVPTYPECNRKPTPEDLEGAKGAHKAATQFYDRGEYDKAIRYWNDALGFDCTANDLLRNIGNAYERKGDLPSTVITLDTYLKRTGPNPTIEEKVKNLKARIAQQADAGAAPTSTTPTPQPTVTVSVQPTTTATAPPPEGPRPYGNTPWFVVGGGGALAIIGAILLPVGYGNVSTAAGQCNANHMCTNQSAIDQGNAGRAEVGAGWALLTLGAAAAAGGLVWQLNFNKPRAPAGRPRRPGCGWPRPGPGRWARRRGARSRLTPHGAR